MHGFGSYNIFRRVMKMSGIQNMTEGNVPKTILRFFFPMLLTNLLQQLYSAVDAAIVGKGIGGAAGDNALAAVGNAATVSLFIIGFLQGLSNGISVMTAQYYGAGNYTHMRKAITSGIKICGSASVIITAASIIFIRKIMLLMQTDPMILDDSLLYSYIIFGGTAVTAAYNLCSGILRAIGDSKTPFTAIIFSSLINIVLDIIFIFVLKAGVGGAAAATVISQLVSALICLAGIKKNEFIRLYRSDFERSSDICKLLLKNGLPMAFMNSVTAAGCIAVQSYINILGADGTSAYAVCTKYLNLSMLPSITAGFTISAFTGQNYGAGKYSRIKEGVRTGLFIALISYILLGSLMSVFPKSLAHLMLNGETAVTYTAEYLKILGMTLLFLNCIFIFRSAVQGMGHPSVPMLSGIAEMLLRLAAIMLLLPRIGFTAAAYADLAAWIGALSLNITAYLRLTARLERRTAYESK